MEIEVIQMNFCLFSRTSMTALEERLHRLRKEMETVREEKTRLNVALDFSKDERNLINKQLKEAQDKSSLFFKNHIHNSQLFIIAFIILMIYEKWF